VSTDGELPVRRAVELHEHEVPDLDPAIAIGIGGAGRPTGNLRAVVVEDFAARAARAGFAHLPKVVGAAARFVTDADDLFFRNTHFLVPQVERLVVGRVHGDHQPRGIDLQSAGHEIPGEADRVFLEVIAEGEVAQHLEEGVMAGGVADVFEVVVFAAGAYAALAGGGAYVVALFLAEEAVLELHHAGIGEQQRRVVARDEAGGCDHGVATIAEKFEEGATDIRRAHERRLLKHGTRRVLNGFAVWIEVRFVIGGPLQNSADMIR
jgi:hypothetical protein